MRRMGQSANRVYVIDLVEDGILYPERADEFLKRMGAVLTEVGGSLVIRAERVEVEQFAGEPVAVTQRLVARWDSFTPIQRDAEPAPDPDEPGEA